MIIKFESTYLYRDCSHRYIFCQPSNENALTFSKKYNLSTFAMEKITLFYLLLYFSTAYFGLKTLCRYKVSGQIIFLSSKRAGGKHIKCNTIYQFRSIIDGNFYTKIISKVSSRLRNTNKNEKNQQHRNTPLINLLFFNQLTSNNK